MEGLKRLSKSDPLVVCSTTATGEHVIAAAGELHLEICIKDLRDDFMKGAPIKVLDPIVSFNEAIKGSSSQTIVTKSQNSHNRIYATGAPIDEDLVKALDNGEVTQEMESKQRIRVLQETYKWDPHTASRIWSFGLPPDGLTNLLIEDTKGTQAAMTTCAVPSGFAALNTTTNTLVGVNVRARHVILQCTMRNATIIVKIVI